MATDKKNAFVWHAHHLGQRATLCMWTDTPCVVWAGNECVCVGKRHSCELLDIRPVRCRSFDFFFFLNFLLDEQTTVDKIGQFVHFVSEDAAKTTEQAITTGVVP